MLLIKAAIIYGSMLAICISWSTYKSIYWAAVHGIMSWLYVISYALKESKLLD